MKTTKSYLAGLSMTGIAIASILSLLVVGTGLVAFHGASEPRSSNRGLERVVVGEDAVDPEAGAASRSEPRAVISATAEHYRNPSRVLTAPEDKRTGAGLAARRPRILRGPGGARVAAGNVLGGGASAFVRTTRTEKRRLGRGSSPSGGQPAPRSRGKSGGATHVPRSAGGLRDEIPEAPGRLTRGLRELGNERRVVPPRVLP